MFSWGGAGYRVDGDCVADERWEEARINSAKKIKLKPTPYRKYFYGKSHLNFFGYAGCGPFIVSSLYDEDRMSYRVTLFSLRGMEVTELDRSVVVKDCWRSLFGRPPSALNVFESALPELSLYASLPVKSTPELDDEVLQVYEPEFAKTLKVGVLYAKEDQMNETEMFFNIDEDASEGYLRFLSLLGEKVALQGFQGYSGGLDLKNNHNGNYSIYSKKDQTEVMYHVSTFLPFFKSDPKQIERKKHVGNDRVVIVYRDGEQPIPADLIRSRQTQILICVSEFHDEQAIKNLAPSKFVDGGGVYYKVALCSKVGVPPCDPDLPDPPIFSARAFSSWIVEKLISSSQSLRFASVFSKKTQREKELILDALVSRFASRKDMMSRKHGKAASFSLGDDVHYGAITD